MGIKIKRKFFIYLGIIISIITIDVLTKYYARDKLEYLVPTPILNEFLRFTLVYNEGLYLKIFQNFSYENKVLFVNIISILFFILLFIFYLVIRKEIDRNFIYSLDLSASFISGGLISNIIERMYRLKTTNFIDIGIGEFRLNIFNLADMFVYIGVIIMIYLLITHHKLDNESKRLNNLK